jgi:hypothetical protein
MGNHHTLPSQKCPNFANFGLEMWIDFRPAEIGDKWTCPLFLSMKFSADPAWLATGFAMLVIAAMIQSAVAVFDA